MKQGVGRPAKVADAEDKDAFRTPPPKRLKKMRKLQLLEASRNQLWNALPDFAAALVQGARKGSVPHLKLLMELGVLEKGMLEGKATSRKEKSVGDLLMEQIRLDRKERAEAEQAEDLRRTTGFEDTQGGVDGV